MAIRGIHGLLYSSDPDATRAFFRNQVQIPGSDIGGGWWIFDFAEGDLGVHPADGKALPGKHDVSLYCDDIYSTVASMKSRGVKFTHAVTDHGYGWVTYFRAPGGITVQLYEPKYEKRASGSAAPAKKAQGAHAKTSAGGPAAKARAKASSAQGAAKPKAPTKPNAAAKPKASAKPKAGAKLAAKAGTGAARGATAKMASRR